MKSNATNTTYLPGCDWTDTESLPPELTELPGDWWVRSSAKQERSTTTGEPVGFRHSLMRGKRAVSSGIGADAARKFVAQAAFLNRNGPVVREIAVCRPSPTNSIPPSTPSTP